MGYFPKTGVDFSRERGALRSRERWTDYLLLIASALGVMVSRRTSFVRG